MRRVRLANKLTTFVVAIVASGSILAYHLDHGISCIEHTPWPMCCEAISLQSASGATYSWWVTPGSSGYFDDDQTGYNYNNFHCHWYANGSVDLYNDIDGVLKGHGIESCDQMPG